MYFLATTAFGLTGTERIDFGFIPTWIRLTVGQKYGTSEGFAHKSVGQTDGSYQWYDSFFQDTSGGKTISSDDAIVSHWERISSVITEKLRVVFDEIDGTEGVFNITVADSNYTVLIEAGN